MPAPETKPDTAFLDTYVRELEQNAVRFPQGSGREDTRLRIAAYAETIARCRERIRAVHDRGGSGRTVCELFGAQADELIRHFARQRFPGDPGGVSLVALGGYGRNELNPFSDIDILFLLRDSRQGAFESNIQAFFQNLWDMNLTIGHSVRTVAECLEAVTQDSDFATSLLESRLLWGDPALLTELKVSYRFMLTCGEGKSQALRKIDERTARLAQHGNTVNIRTPNIKESPGGLRDIHTVRWIMLFLGSGDSLQGLVEKELLNRREADRFDRDYDFLLRGRNALHFVTGKKQDRLDHQVLPEVASSLGYRGSPIELSETFMHDYYSHAGSVFRLTEHVIGRLRARFGPPTLHDLRNDPSELVIIDDKIGFSEQWEEMLPGQPEMILRLYELAAQSGLPISGYASSAIERTMQEHRLDLAANPHAAELFRDMIETRKNLGPVFRQMHDHGVLVRLIPEFESIVWRYQYSYYHAYTTDEHSLRVVENIERMENGTLDGLPELTAIMSEVTARGALYLAGLLHDIGKGKGSGHAARGARMAAQALTRLGFDERTVHLVRTLIQEHLLMTHTSQRRDMEEESTITDFIGRVGDAGMLRMLTILTFADLLSVSDTALNDWKRSLLIRLYRKGLRYFDRGFEKPSPESGDLLVAQVLAGAPEGIDHDAVRSHLGSLPRQYSAITVPSDIRAHLSGISRLERDPVWISFAAHRDMTLLTVITRDYPGALLDICGTITASDINIVAAQIFTRSDGIVIDTFLVVDCAGNPVIAPEVKREFKSNLKRVIARETGTEDLIRNHIRRWCRRRRNMVLSPPRVNVHNDISENYTVIDVFSNDFTGLLFEILRVFAAYEVDIQSAKIGTDEDQVADAFYVRTRAGDKIEDPALLNEISNAIIRAITSAFPETVRS